MRFKESLRNAAASGSMAVALLAGADPAFADNVCSVDNRVFVTKDFWGPVYAAGEPAKFYEATQYGCAKGVKDTGDECYGAYQSIIPECKSKGLLGPACQIELKWGMANGDQFGKGAKVKVRDMQTGKEAVLRVEDRGPRCNNNLQHPYAKLDLLPGPYAYFKGNRSENETIFLTATKVPESTRLGAVDVYVKGNK